MSRWSRALAVSASGAAVLLALALPSCGARTGLFAEGADADAADVDDAPDAHDAADVLDAEDTSDVVDSVPSIDVLPPPDVTPFCTDPSVLLVYVVSESNELLSFEPPSASFHSIGTIRCPAPPNATPFSMAVDHTGLAYVVFSDGELFQVSVKDASCKATSYRSPGGNYTTFGMGFARDPNGMGETLYVASDTTSATSLLGTIAMPALTVRTIAQLDPSVSRAELTGTGAGQLFGFFTDPASATGFASIAEIDTATGRIRGRADLQGVTQGQGWAFAFWGGDFYTFTAPSGQTVVTRFRPTDGSIVPIANYPGIIVGAGVSTCAPG
jgi:hypothetical protein